MGSDRSNERGQAALSARLLDGALWSVAIRWVSKVLGFVSLAICARVLTPADYGLINMAMVLAGFFNVFANFGIDAALIRNQHAEPQDYDTAWSIKVIQNVVLGLAMAAVAPLADGLYGDARVSGIVLCIAAATAFGGLSNIYIIDFQKRLDFRTDFILNIVPRIVAVATAIALALLLRSYWALVISICSTYISTVLFSYIMVRQRPKWSLRRARSLLGFSTWYLLQGLAEFVQSQADRLLLGTRTGAASLGMYAIARETAALPNTEISLPLSRVLLPALSTISHDQARFSKAVRQTLGALLAVIGPASVLLASLAPEFVRVLLGPQWDGAAPLLAILSLAGVCGAVRIVTNSTLTSLGRVRLGAGYAWLQAILFLIGLLPALAAGGLTGVAWLLLGLAVLIAGVQLGTLYYVGVFQRLPELLSLLRPLIAVAVMAGCVLTAKAQLPPGPPLLALFAYSALGISVYLFATAVLMVINRDPDGHERMLVSLIRTRLQRSTRRAT